MQYYVHEDEHEVILDLELDNRWVYLGFNWFVQPNVRSLSWYFMKTKI